jgi:IS30 family transposase
MAFLEERMDKFETILNDLPEKPARSRLDPYTDLIRELLTRGWTYREIARILLENCGVHISISTIHYFVRTRSRSKRKVPKPHWQKLGKQKEIPTVRKEEKEIANPGKEIPVNDEVYQRIAALKQRPASSEQSSGLFHYDPDEPLHLSPKTGTDRSGK